MKTQSTRQSPPPASLMLKASPLLVLCATLSCGAPPPSTSSGPPTPKDKGGISLVVAVKAGGESLERSVEQTLAVIRNRCDHLGVFCDVRREGGAGANRIALRVSGPHDSERIRRVLLAQGLLELRPLVSPPNPSPPTTYPTRAEAVAAAGVNHDVLPYVGDDAEPGTFLVVERTRVVGGQDLRDAEALSETSEHDGGYLISFSLKPEGAARLGSWTAANIGRYVAVALNGEARSVPYIRSQITEDGQITGDFTREQAEDVALTLRSGALPAPVEVLEEGAYEP